MPKTTKDHEFMPYFRVVSIDLFSQANLSVWASKHGIGTNGIADWRKPQEKKS